MGMSTGSDAGPAKVAGANEFVDGGGVDGFLAMGWGSGYVQNQPRCSGDVF